MSIDISLDIEKIVSEKKITYMEAVLLYTEDIDGEIYISWDRILDNSKSLEISHHIEFKRILIHGVLHLIGYDDQTEIEKSQMTKLEDKYIQKFSEEFYEC